MRVGLRLVLRGVSHAYRDLVVLENIDLVAEPGEVMVLVGPSGCGKSTLLGIMGGMLTPVAGEVRCEGDVADDCLNPLTYVFQDFALLPWRTVAGNISLVLEDRLSASECAARVAEVLALTGLAEFAAAWPRQLSGGMRQRVGIARALAVRPACLLMDEPLSSLDAQTRDLMLDEFASLIERAGTTTIYVTHNLAEAVRLGQQIVVLSRRPGRVRAIERIDRPLAGRAASDPDLQAIEAALWRMIRDDAAAAAQEIEGLPPNSLQV
jgi:NitT/TauT family transport system ATP-binding protein